MMVVMAPDAWSKPQKPQKPQKRHGHCRFQSPAGVFLHDSRWSQKSPDVARMPTDTTHTSRPVSHVVITWRVVCLKKTLETRVTKKLEKPRKIRIRSPPWPSAYTPAATSRVPAEWQLRSAASVNSWSVIRKNRWGQLTSWTSWEMILTEDRLENTPVFSGSKTGFLRISNQVPCDSLDPLDEASILKLIHWR